MARSIGFCVIAGGAIAGTAAAALLFLVIVGPFSVSADHSETGV
jgi:hypothetical protein